MRRISLSLLFALLFVLQQLPAQVITSAQIDSLTELVLTTFDVPGIAVGIVKDGKLIHAKGYGVRSLDSRKHAVWHCFQQ